MVDKFGEVDGNKIPEVEGLCFGKLHAAQNLTRSTDFGVGSAEQPDAVAQNTGPLAAALKAATPQAPIHTLPILASVHCFQLLDLPWLVLV